MKVLILGVSGMLGSTMLRVFNKNLNGVEVYGTARSPSVHHFFPSALNRRIITGVDVENLDLLMSIIGEIKPDVVINCIGIVSHLAETDDPLKVLQVNLMFPHRLAMLCRLCGARLVHFSTDGVFSGSKGNYCESDIADATDLYGRAKYMGELGYSHTITIRTSIIGHDLASDQGLLGWFLSQENEAKGYSRAIFSGLPAVELARVIRDIVLPQPNISGLYHVASAPISKYELLRLVADVYGKSINIVPDHKLVIDRSLNADRFYLATGYVSPAWKELVRQMHEFTLED